MKLRKVLSMVLCLCMLLACVPVMGVLAEEAAQQTVRIEAENATWNKYAKASDAAFSGGAKLGNITAPILLGTRFPEDISIKTTGCMLPTM